MARTNSPPAVTNFHDAIVTPVAYEQGVDAVAMHF
jgi:hypothetical protein